jgi:hypothetical protein
MGPTNPAAALLELVALGGEDRLPDDADDDLGAVAEDAPHSADGTDRADDARRPECRGASPHG